MSMSLTYAGSGVNYAGGMDAFKIQAGIAGRSIAQNITRLNGGEFREYEPSRGESAFLIEAAKSYLAHLNEGLGTKDQVARRMYLLTGVSYFGNIGQCTVAMGVNDIITTGALPLSVTMHLSVGASSWFEDQRRSQDLIRGWAHACNLARCSWGGGETAVLKGNIDPEETVFGCSVMGLVKPKERLLEGEKIQDGDVIILLESSGIHANGLTLARTIAERKDGWWARLKHFFFPRKYPLRALPDGYLTKMSDGRAYGEALLDPTHIYVGLVEDCLNAGVDIHYAVNITGHGWRKLMRADRALTYVINQLPTPLPIFDFILKHGPVEIEEAYGNLNMSAGFALIIGQSSLEKFWPAYNSASRAFKALVAGWVESGPRRVVIKPLNIVFEGDSLNIR